MAPSDGKTGVPALTPQFLYGVKKGVNGGLNFLGTALPIFFDGNTLFHLFYRVMEDI